MTFVVEGYIVHGERRVVITELFILVSLDRCIQEFGLGGFIAKVPLVFDFVLVKTPGPVVYV